MNYYARYVILTPEGKNCPYSTYLNGETITEALSALLTIAAKRASLSQGSVAGVTLEPVGACFFSFLPVFA